MEQSALTGFRKVKKDVSWQKAKESTMEKMELDEKKFRWMMNEDAMATEKLANPLSAVYTYFMDSLSGSVERITYYNSENGYTVLRLRGCSAKADQQQQHQAGSRPQQWSGPAKVQGTGVEQ